MAGPAVPLLYGIFAVAAAGARTGAALRPIILKLGTKAAELAAKHGKLIKKITKAEAKTIKKKTKLNGATVTPPSAAKTMQERYNLPPMSDKTAKAIQVAGFATIAGKSAERVYDTEKKKRSQIAAKKKTGHVDYRTGGMFYKSGRK